ncbi:hypothetical protein DXG01_007241 [Tephrocybe rancida]|nr:hypothetical protein DXG01_007241 [Tephrocybe rancida]
MAMVSSTATSSSEEGQATEGLDRPEPRSKEEVEDVISYPDGGRQAWMTVFGAALAQYATFGWIGGVQIFLILTFGIATGRAFDQGYFRQLMLSGSILHSVSWTDDSSRPILAHLLPALAITSHYFKRKQPLATGIVTAGTALGKYQSSLGFHNGVRVAAAITSGLLVIANLMMSTRLPPSTKRKTIPLADFARDPPYVLVLLGGMLIISGFSFPVFFLQLYSSVHGLSDNFSTYILSIVNACSVAGRIVPSALAPKLGIVNMVIFFTFCMAILEYSLLLVSNKGGFIAFAVVYGFFSGAGVALTPAMLAMLARDVDEVGARIGVSFALSGVL